MKYLELIKLVNESEEFTPKHSICEVTGFRVCELMRNYFLREDGYFKNVRSTSIGKDWSPGSSNGRYLMAGIPGARKFGFANNMTNIHNLMGVAFLPNPDEKKTINHINSIKTDNRLSNLEWNTHSENMQHAVENRKSRKPRQSKKIGRFTMEGELIETYHNERKKMIEQGYLDTQVWLCCKGFYKTHKGYVWKFID